MLKQKDGWLFQRVRRTPRTLTESDREAIYNALLTVLFSGMRPLTTRDYARAYDALDKVVPVGRMPELNALKNRLIRRDVEERRARAIREDAEQAQKTKETLCTNL